MDKNAEFAINYIKKELEKEANENIYFSERLNNPKKNYNDMWNYIVTQAKKSSGSVVHSSQMVRWATDYFNDDDIKIDSNIKCSGKIMLENEDEDEEYDDMVVEEKVKPAKTNTPAKQAKPVKKPTQQSLFDF